MIHGNKYNVGAYVIVSITTLIRDEDNKEGTDVEGTLYY